MSPRNRYDRTGENQVRGHECEEAFKKTLINKGLTFRYATGDDQKKRKIDFFVEEGGKTVKYEVKSIKKLRRSDPEPREDILWLEFYSVGGNTGWLRGDSDFIAFELKNTFMVIDRVKLLAFAQEKCDLDNVVDNQEDAFYKGYTRYEWNDRSRPRNDLMSLVWTKDVLHLVHDTVKKV